MGDFPSTFMRHWSMICTKPFWWYHLRSNCLFWLVGCWDKSIDYEILIFMRSYPQMQGFTIANVICPQTCSYLQLFVAQQPDEKSLGLQMSSISMILLATPILAIARVERATRLEWWLNELEYFIANENMKHHSCKGCTCVWNMESLTVNTSCFST